MICPAYAGMILSYWRSVFLIMNLSRVCGDDPGDQLTDAEIAIFVPRMRG